MGLLNTYAGQHGRAEIAVAVDENWRRGGLATRLLSWLVERTRKLGIECGEAEILRGNAPALQLARNFGGRIESDYRSAFVVKVRAPLSASAMLANVVSTLPTAPR
ncbi:MAG: GNAT family N-acetyltransferase [Betaproteobacteria bacterium]